jgi:hypothetical protein
MQERVTCAEGSTCRALRSIQQMHCQSLHQTPLGYLHYRYQGSHYRCAQYLVLKSNISCGLP